MSPEKFQDVRETRPWWVHIIYDIPKNSTSCQENSDFFQVFASDHEKTTTTTTNKQTNK